jgi:Fur family ferric uptake transcriptional regulator/Fur family zinc uptake transcriptional regulator
VKQNHADEAAGLMHAGGMRITQSRTDILGFLIDAGHPLSHAEIQKAIPGADRVTLYRTLARFAEKEIIHQVAGPDGAWRFCAHPPDRKGCPGNHPHFLCTSCGEMICLTGQNLPRVDVPGGFEVKGKQFVVYGRCPACASES